MCDIDLKFNLDSYVGALGRFLDPFPILMLEKAKKKKKATCAEKYKEQ